MTLDLYEAQLMTVARAQTCIGCQEPMPPESLGQAFCSIECAAPELGPDIECEGCQTWLHASALTEGYCRWCSDTLDELPRT